MNFLALEALSRAWQTAAISAAVGVVGLLVAMYFLKLKRMRKEIPSTFLWKKSIMDMRANSPFQRLRRNLLLFLQLLILIAALIAFGRPAMQATARTGATYIVLLDNSASMGATDVSPSRLDAGKAQVEKIISDMGAGDAMMLMTFASHSRVEQTLTDDRNALKAALRRVEATDGRTDINDPLQLADAISKTSASPQIVVVSDGAFLQPPSMEALSAPVQFIGVGKDRSNVGITAMSVRRSVDTPDTGEIFANVANYTDQEVKAVVSLNIDGQLTDATTTRIAAGAAHASVFKVKMDADKIAEVMVDYKDDLDADNRAWALLEKPTDVEVTFIGQTDPFLRKAVLAGGRFKVSEAATDQIPAQSGTNLPVYIYDGTAPQSLSRAGYLIFNAAPAIEGFKEGDIVENPVIIDVDTSHPITSFLDLGDVYIGKARRITFPPETKVLVNSDEIPLVALSYVGGARILTVAFDPLESRWPLRISYPMFISNAINFLSGGTEALSSRQFNAGDVLVVPGEEGVDKITITDPAGHKKDITANVSQGMTPYGDTGRAGIYTVKIGDRELSYAANLTSGAESDLTPRRELVVGTTKVSAAVSAKAKNREIWRELLVFAFAILMVEWYIYNRRVYV